MATAQVFLGRAACAAAEEISIDLALQLVINNTPGGRRRRSPRWWVSSSKWVFLDATLRRCRGEIDRRGAAVCDKCCHAYGCISRGGSS
eukprot:2676190-Amphidinium_carterae.3